MSRGPVPAPLTREAKAAGCSCEEVVFGGRRELVTNADCPLHGDRAPSPPTEAES